MWLQMPIFRAVLLRLWVANKITTHTCLATRIVPSNHGLIYLPESKVLLEDHQLVAVETSDVSSESRNNSSPEGGKGSVFGLGGGRGACVETERGYVFADKAMMAAGRWQELLPLL